MIGQLSDLDFGGILRPKNLPVPSSSGDATNKGYVDSGDADVEAYAASLVVGTSNKRGDYDASVNVFPSTGGTGIAGAVLKGNYWNISVQGTLGGMLVKVKSRLEALVDTPGQTLANWEILEPALGYTSENIANKTTSVSADGGSDTKYPSAKAVKTYADAIAGSFLVTQIFT